MSKNYSSSKVMSELFADATKEIIERTRIKAQMTRLAEIMEADAKRLRNAYAEIGRMYCEGSLEKNKAKVEMLYDTIEHLNQREERAKARYEQLKAAHSVDECTTAFKEELEARIEQAKTKTADTARDLGARAKVAAENFPDKAQDTISNIKKKAAVAADKAKAAVDEVAAKASAAVSRIGNDAEANAEDEYSQEDNFRDMLDELEYSYDDEDEDDNYIEEYSEEDQAAAADISAILGSIGLALKEVDETEVIAEEPAPEEADPADKASDSDGESPESFDF